MNNTGTDVNDFEGPYNVTAIVVIVMFFLFSVVLCVSVIFNKHPNVC